MNTAEPSDTGRAVERPPHVSGPADVSRAKEVTLRLRVQHADDDGRDLTVVAQPTTTVAEIGSALAEYLKRAGNGPDHARLTSPRLGHLPASATIEDAGLLNGDLLHLGGDDGDAGPAKHVTPAAGDVVDLVVVGGPSSGLRRSLTPGKHKVGRDPRCTILLNDRFVSREHLIVDVGVDGVTVCDADSSNRSFVEGARLAGEHGWRHGEIIEAGTSLLTIGPSRTDGDRAPRARGISDPYTGRIDFNRPPRVKRPFVAPTLNLPRPPDDPRRQRLPLAAALAPLLVGVGMAVVMKRPEYLAFAALSPIMATWSFVENRRSGRGQFRKEAEEFRAGIGQAVETARAYLVEEAARRREAAPSAEELMARAVRLDPTLWERRPKDDDFLVLRSGWSDQPSFLRLELAEGGNEELRRIAEEVRDEYRAVPAVPVTLSLREAGVVGVCGERADVIDLARWLLVQIAVLHSPDEIKIAGCVEESDMPEWEWLTWLPHTGGERGEVDGALVAATSAHAQMLLEDLTKLIELRREDISRYSTSREFSPNFVVVIDDRVRLPRSLLKPLLSEGPALGFFVIWMTGDSADLPGQATAVIDIDGESGEHQLIRPEVGDSQTSVTDIVSLPFATELAVALSRVRDTGGTSASASIPRNVSFLDLVDRPAADPRPIIEAWRSGGVGLGAPVGIKGGGRFEVDLRHDGPHALVGGTTGSGKSELLQTLIVSLAVRHSPARLNYLLVDYKGGAAFKDCVKLPHTVGFVTDLDGHLVRRALVSLNAELRRREHVLRDAGVRNLIELQRRDPDNAPPSLVIVIDEFATLVKELPDFVAGVVDVAQRGRSLGVHLVLATQRPAGVINESIRANTNLRIALRVGDESDSQDVLGIRDAAHISRLIPGRGFARTGQGEITEFQTAYVGGHSLATADTPAVLVYDTRLGRSMDRAGGDGNDEDAPTDLQRLTDLANQVATQLRLAKPRAPWLPPMPSAIPLDSIAEPAEISPEPASAVTVGVIDEPELQRQRPHSFDFEKDGNLLIFGSGGSGKSTLLRTVAVSLARSASPADARLYALDFATGGLQPLSAIPHCGAVIGDDVERVSRLYRMLQKWIGERKELFARTGASTLREFRRMSPQFELPRIVVLLDGYDGFVAAFERIDFGHLTASLPRLVGEGRSLGVHFVITADRRGAVPAALSGIVPTKVVLKMADDDDYGALGVDVRVARAAELSPGRGFISGTTEFQAAVVSSDPSGEGQATAIARLAGDLQPKYGHIPVPGVGSLPSTVSRDTLQPGAGAFDVPIGISDVDLESLYVDLNRGHLILPGPHRSGRSTALVTIATALRKQSPDLGLHLLAPRRTTLTDLDIWTSVAQGADECDAFAVSREADPVQDAEVVIVDDAEELVGTSTDAALIAYVKRGRDTGCRMVVGVERQSAHRAYTGFIAEVKKDRYGVLLKPDVEIDGDLLGVKLPRYNSLLFPPGRGYLVERGEITLTQVAC